jgi:hypothetical protein
MLGLIVFFVVSMVVVMLAGSLVRPLGLDLHHLFPLYLGIIVCLSGAPFGAYYGIILARRTRGYSFRDYYRSIREFLSDAR